MTYSNENIARLVALDKAEVMPVREAKYERLDRVKFSPAEAQVAFIKELIKKPEEADKFIENPKGYSVEHGILLDPALVKEITDSVVFDSALDEDLVAKLGPQALKDLVDLRVGSPIGPVANAAAVAAGAAVVMAVVAVVTMVVTLVRSSKPADLVSLQALGEKGILLPGGAEFIARDIALRNINVARNIARGRI